MARSEVGRRRSSRRAFIGFRSASAIASGGRTGSATVVTACSGRNRLPYAWTQPHATWAAPVSPARAWHPLPRVRPPHHRLLDAAFPSPSALEVIDDHGVFVADELHHFGGRRQPAQSPIRGVAGGSNWYCVIRNPPMPLAIAPGRISKMSLERKRAHKAHPHAAWCRRTASSPIPPRNAFFKRPIEFQTCVMGNRGRKKDFLRRYEDFLRASTSGRLRRTAGNAQRRPIRRAFRPPNCRAQARREARELLAVAHEHAALADQPDGGDRECGLIRLGQKTAHEIDRPVP